MTRPSLEQLAIVATKAAQSARHARWPGPPSVMPIHTNDGMETGRSTVDSWARLVLAARRAPGDLPTLRDWAAFVGVSMSSLRLRCYAAGVSPRASLRFARLLRAVVVPSVGNWSIQQWVDAADPRTLRSLSSLGGLPLSSTEPPTVEHFLQQQRFVEMASPALAALKILLGVKS